MGKIVITVSPEDIEDVKSALYRQGINSMTITAVLVKNESVRKNKGTQKSIPDIISAYKIEVISDKLFTRKDVPPILSINSGTKGMILINKRFYPYDRFTSF